MKLALLVRPDASCPAKRAAHDSAAFHSQCSTFQPPARKLPASLQRVALRKLVQLDAAALLDDLRVPPGNRLEKLAWDRAGRHSIRINDQFRVCFRWAEGDAHDVEIVDYH